MSKNTSITLGSHFDAFLKEQIDSGRYGSVSEAIRAALRLLEEREAALTRLRQALVEGEESGEADYSLDGLLEELDA
ncbi:type II toxin-antitoxin system ParD family antitoxin [Emcibacter nanhaiensis]|uniref:Type II toxin-antitoxin system ParD family antitoxin n=1 Tax=Emcibacter nanhaiensis TaxID=1505037 RepID=A0A501PB19_9PROT|nr:type II toxin-antitoxin system ParD family antitoxin [Emcibacter nanhaiensis]TPD57388.1 type II toxin-antitoxin system ParD family antitoxin [Emcibacter nanhaiensis]